MAGRVHCQVTVTVKAVRREETLMEAVMMEVVMMAMTRMRVWNLYDRYFCELRLCPFRARFSPRSEAAPAGGTAVKPATARPPPLPLAIAKCVSLCPGAPSFLKLQGVN